MSAVTFGLIIIAVAVGLIVYYTTENVLGTIGVVLLIVGALLSLTALGYSAVPDKFGPSEAMYRLVAGLVAADIGLVVLLAGFTNLGAIILIAIFLIILAAVGIMTALVNGKEEK
jgi:hypothetical protein